MNRNGHCDALLFFNTLRRLVQHAFIPAEFGQLMLNQVEILILLLQVLAKFLAHGSLDRQFLRLDERLNKHAHREVNIFGADVVAKVNFSIGFGHS